MLWAMVMAGAITVFVSSVLSATLFVLVGLVVLGVAVAIATVLGRRSGQRELSQRLTALGSRLGIDPPEDESSIEVALSYLEHVTGAATEAVAESSADAIRLRRSLDTLPQGVVLCDENGTVVYRNARANALMTSRHGDALAAQAVTELLEDAWHESAAERTLDLYGPPRRTLTVRAKVIDDGRRPLGVIAIIEDVSERRRLEEIRRDFVANVSHELKTPMGALGLLAETLVSEPDVAVAQRLAGRIHTEAFRVSRIIDDLLDLSRIESEEVPPREPVLVNLVMAEAVERVRATADQRGIVIELHEPAPPVAIMGDRRQLVSAMHALLENAVTYSYDNSVIVVAGTIDKEPVEKATDDPPDLADTEVPEAVDMREIVRLSVADKGIGIPARDLERIFERFYRVDHGRSRDTGGTGLGLSIVRHVASNHQGWVDVESREGDGSTFTLVLPIQAERNL
jgi:two-component system sensor histidine kinase SenX3